MFNNVGAKIKALAKIICWLGIIASVITAIVFIGEEEYLIALCTILGGILGSWLGSIGLYAFGELVENVAEIRAATEASLALAQREAAAPVQE